MSPFRFNVSLTNYWTDGSGIVGVTFQRGIADCALPQSVESVRPSESACGPGQSFGLGLRAGTVCSTLTLVMRYLGSTLATFVILFPLAAQLSCACGLDHDSGVGGWGIHHCSHSLSSERDRPATDESDCHEGTEDGESGSCCISGPSSSVSSHAATPNLQIQATPERMLAAVAVLDMPDLPDVPDHLAGRSSPQPLFLSHCTFLI